MEWPNCFLLEALDLPCQTLHAVVVDVCCSLEHYLAPIAGFWNEFPAQLPHDVDRVVIMVVSDQAFSLVGRLSDDILRHVHACGVCVPSLDCIFAIPPHSSD
jgi:hypothetical protein